MLDSRGEGSRRMRTHRLKSWKAKYWMSSRWDSTSASQDERSLTVTVILPVYLLCRPPTITIGTERGACDGKSGFAAGRSGPDSSGRGLYQGIYPAIYHRTGSRTDSSPAASAAGTASVPAGPGAYGGKKLDCLDYLCWKSGFLLRRNQTERDTDMKKSIFTWMGPPAHRFSSARTDQCGSFDALWG